TTEIYTLSLRDALPIWIAHLDGPPEVRAGGREELVEARGVASPSGRQLDEGGSRGRAEATHALHVVRQPRRRVAQLHAVRSERPELQRVLEAGWRLAGPLVDRRERRESVEGVVELDGVEQGGVVLEPPPLWQVPWVHDAAPVGV